MTELKGQCVIMEGELDCLDDMDQNDFVIELLQRVRSRPLSSEIHKAREDVLDQVRDRCAEKMSDRNPSIGGVMLSYILADLRGGEL